MKHILFYLTFSLIFFSGSSVFAQKPCIKVNGADPTPSTIVGEPPYAYKCSNNSIKLEVVDCYGNFVDPSQYDSRIWYDPSRYAINGPINLDAFSAGIWTIVISYTDPVFGTITTDSAKVKLINYTAVTPPLVINEDSSSKPHCAYETIKFRATNSNSYLPNSYKWYVNNNATPLDTTTVAWTGVTFTTQIPTSKTVLVTAIDINGCKVRDQILAALLGSPNQPDLGPDILKCNTETQVINSYSTAPTSDLRFSWNGGLETTSPSYTVTTAGKYWVTVSSTILTKSCKVADTLYVTNKPSPIFTIGGDTSICYQADGPLHAKSSSSLTYTWTPGTYFPGGNTGANPVIDFNGVGLGTYTISVVGKDGNNCTTTKTQNVTHLAQGSNPYMNVTAPPLDICIGSTSTFNTTATTTYLSPLTYEWTPATHLSSGSIKQPIVDLTGEPLNTPVNYSLKVSDNAGCYLTITTSATLVPAVVANVAFSDSSICLGNTIQLQSSGTGGTGTLNYTWSPTTNLNDPAVPNPNTTPIENRLYTVTVSDSKGCSDSKTVDIKAINVMVKMIPTDTFGYNTEPMVLNPMVNSTDYTYQWTNVTTSTSLGTDRSQIAAETGTYAVMAIEPVSTCYATDTINVTIQVGNPRLIYVPNVVNPASSNPENKTVKVYGTAVQENDFTFRIYNKWGEMIYETSSFTDANTNGWNGVYKSVNGAEQNLAVYTYSLHGRYFDGQEFDKTGSITLMR